MPDLEQTRRLGFNPRLLATTRSPTLPFAHRSEASSSLAREYIYIYIIYVCTYMSSIPDRAPLYLPVTSMTILTRVSTLRRVPFVLDAIPSPRVVRHRGPWIVLVNRAKLVQGAAARCALCSRAAIYCVFEIMQSSGCRLPLRWLLCTSIPFFPLLLLLFPSSCVHKI